jgi:poly(beta-D-mannuronate) lyase
MRIRAVASVVFVASFVACQPGAVPPSDRGGGIAGADTPIAVTGGRGGAGSGGGGAAGGAPRDPIVDAGAVIATMDAASPSVPDARGPDARATPGGASGAGGSGGATARWPSAVLDLTNWKITLPIAGASATKPLEITQPQLAGYAISPWFVVSPAGDGVVFRANAGGVTTSNSGYPRSELREMANDGRDNASWSTTSGTHELTITASVTHLPAVKPHVVAGQIHDASDDVVMIRLEGTHLFLEGGGKDLGTLDPDYHLGTKFTAKLLAADGHIQAFYGDLDHAKVDVARAATGCYFKAGVYTQSNPTKGDAPDAYGEVTIYALRAIHR